jgi:hypothetical protein
MSRDDGFGTADVDTGLLDDTKLRRLIRATRDEAVITRCIVGYIAVVLSSWRAGERVTLEDAAPVWMTGVDDLIAKLAEAGLLDADGRIPEHAWTGWFEPAWRRREERRASGRKGGLAKAENRQAGSDAVAQLEQSQAEALPGSTVRPVSSVRTDRASRPAPARAKPRTNGTPGTTIEPTLDGICGYLSDLWGRPVTAEQRRMLYDFADAHRTREYDEPSGYRWMAGLVLQAVESRADPIEHLRLVTDADRARWRAEADAKEAESAARRRTPRLSA